MSTAKQDTFGDSRLKKVNGQVSRGSRDSADLDRVQEDGQSLTAEQRRKMLRQEWVQEILPTPPEMPGFHCCWVSTTNSTDPVYKRLQRGYTPVKVSEVPGFGSQFAVSEGEFEGCVRCNEMLLFKIPMNMYQDLMAIYHHDMPLEQEAAIRDNVNAHGEVDSNGRQLAEVDGDFNKLGRSRGREPTFI